MGTVNQSYIYLVYFVPRDIVCVYLYRSCIHRLTDMSRGTTFIYSFNIGDNMQTTNLGNETIGAIWGELVSNQLSSKYMLEEDRARYSNSSHKDASFHIVVTARAGIIATDEITGARISKNIGLATCYSYGAAICKLVLNAKTRKFEHWTNNTRYSHTTGRHQSVCRSGTFGMNSSPDVETFDFSWTDDINSLNYSHFHPTRANCANRMLERITKKASSLREFVNTPRRQKQTIARYCSEFIEWLEAVEHCTLGEEDLFPVQLGYIDQYKTAARGCVDFDGDKHVFNAVMALID